MAIFNLTQHEGTPEQGVYEPAPHIKEEIKNLLTFEEIPTAYEITTRAESLALIVRRSGVTSAMIGGAPYLMPALERALKNKGIVPLYSFSRRESEEQIQPDGKVKKTTVFRHAGWVLTELDVTRECNCGSGQPVVICSEADDSCE